MKKKLIVLLVVLCMALGAGTTLTAFAGVNQNSPTGDGLMTGGGLNTTNYSLRGDSEPSAYSYQKGATIYDMSGVSTAHNVSAYQVVGENDFDDVAKFVMKVDIYDFGANASSENFAIGPFVNCQRIDWVGNDMMSVALRPVNGGTKIQLIKGKEIKDYDTLPEILVNSEQVTLTDNVASGFGLQTDLLQAEHAKGRNYITYWFEFNILDKSMTIFAGYDDGAGNVEKKEYGTIKDAFNLSLNENNQATGRTSWLWQPGSDIKFDNYKLYSVKEDGAEKKVYIDCNFDTEDSVTYDPMYPNGTKLSITSNGTALVGKFYTLDSAVTVTNPNKDARIVSNNALAVDNRLEKTFEMQAAFKLVNFGNESTRKVGVALGLNDYRAVLSAPKNGASFIYLTKNEEGQIVLGADNIAEDGTATAAGAQTVINGAALNTTILLNITGKKDGSVDVTVGEQTVNFKDIKANGNVAIAQTGEGDVTFSVLANDFKVTGYQLTENEGEKVTSSFNGNWLSPAKFNFQNQIAPTAHVTAVEGGHAVTGMTPENGKVGFYGTSTNAALTFSKKYSDFVMQFDYISVPYGKRGVLGNVVARFSPLYITFGADSAFPTILDNYCMGILEGNGSFFDLGAESLIYMAGTKASGYIKDENGNNVATESGLKMIEEGETIPEYAIPHYSSKGVIDGYGLPSDAEKSFYNKTTRFKLVVINNNVALWAANVDENGAVVGDYRKIVSGAVPNSYGYVGFITDSPAWCELDNIAITPISTQTALDKGLNAEPAADLVADVPVSEMAADPMPEMLAKPVLTADTAAKKVTWNAIEGAGEYAVTVRFNGEEVDAKTVTATEYDMSKYTDKGDYTVSVVAIPADLEAYQKSLNANITYTVSDDGNGSGDNKPGGNETETNEPDEGCGCGGSVNGALGSAAIVLILGGVAILIRRRKA